VKKNIEAVLWDNDGVLVDTEQLFFEITRQVFARYDLKLTADLWGDLYLSKHAKKSDAIAALLGADKDRIPAMLDERNAAFQKLLRQAPPIRPRVHETLNALAGRVRMAIVTGSRRDQFQLMHANTDLEKFFEVIVTGDQGANRKPHPELYLIAMKSMGVKPENCIAIEDSQRGFTAARAAGVPCIVVPTDLTRHLNYEGALAVEPDVSGVLRFINA
jgi:HAD superfamily hydrolase (TIGR01509 family)